MKNAAGVSAGLLIAAALMLGAQEHKSNYNGLNLGMGNLSRLSRAREKLRAMLSGLPAGGKQLKIVK